MLDIHCPGLTAYYERGQTHHGMGSHIQSRLFDVIGRRAAWNGHTALRILAGPLACGYCWEPYAAVGSGEQREAMRPAQLSDPIRMTTKKPDPM